MWKQKQKRSLVLVSALTFSGFRSRMTTFCLCKWLNASVISAVSLRIVPGSSCVLSGTSLVPIRVVRIQWVMQLFRQRGWGWFRARVGVRSTDLSPFFGEELRSSSSQQAPARLCGFRVWAKWKETDQWIQFIVSQQAHAHCRYGTHTCSHKQPLP